MRDPVRYQHDVLMEIIYKGCFTEFGAKHGFETVKDYDSFVRQVPVRDYPEFSPYIDRMRKREENVLWPGIVDMYSKSSGTTSGKSKYIPVTREYLEANHLQGASDTLSILYNQDAQLGLFGGKNMIIGGSIENLSEYPDVISGDISALLLNHMPWYGRQVFTPSMEIAIANDWEFKLSETIKEVIHQPLVMFAGVPTWLVVLFRRILFETNKENLLQIWPLLKLYIHGGVNFNPIKPIFRDLIPREDFIYHEVYNASEGYFASQNKIGEEGMLLLMNHAVFYEFKEINSDYITSVEGIESNKQYQLIITNTCGLWRYETGDVIECLSTVPIKIRVVGRTTQFINAFGEEVIVDNVEKAISLASQKHQCIVTDYTVAPRYMHQTQAAHEWIIEFDRAPSDYESFADTLDQALQNINSDYEAKRTKSIALQRLIIHVAPKGSFYQWMQSQGKLGGQHKVPRLKNDRSFIEPLLIFLESLKS